MKNEKCCICGKETLNGYGEMATSKQFTLIKACPKCIQNKKEIQKLCKTKAIFEHFGKMKQIEKIKEEMFELAQAIESNNKENIIEEMADVIVLMQQFRLLHEISVDEIIEMHDFKINRTIERIESDFYEWGYFKGEK